MTLTPEEIDALCNELKTWWARPDGRPAGPINPAGEKAAAAIRQLQQNIKDIHDKAEALTLQHAADVRHLQEQLKKAEKERDVYKSKYQKFNDFFLNELD